MLRARFRKYNLIFKQPAATSRGVLIEKASWFIFVFDDLNPDITGIGECAPLIGLSVDYRPDFETILEQTCRNIEPYADQTEKLKDYPSITFGLETALLDFRQEGRRVLFPSDFTNGKDSIAINGLVWMGSSDEMRRQIKEKIESGLKCVKLKIGAINFEDELTLIRTIRRDFSSSEIEIRVDANGAFEPEEALAKLKQLSVFHIHSIEQPVKQGQWDKMAELCKTSPIPVALDEELIGFTDYNEKKRLLEFIQPHYIILKPSLLGGFKASEEWIDLANERKVGWWITSALESNIGLNAIAQWTYTFENKMPQGLGTGQLFVNNFGSPLKIKQGKLFYDPKEFWDLSKLVE